MLESKKIKLTAFLAGLACVFAQGCSSVEKANIPATANPNEEVSRLESDLKMGLESQYDALAYKEFWRSYELLNQAKAEIKDGDSQADIIDTLERSRGYYDRASELAENRAPKFEGVLNIRNNVIKAGVRNYPRESETLEGLDEKLRRYATSSRDISVKSFDDLQKDYLDLQVGTVQAAQLGDARAKIESAIKSGAKRNTPNTLRVAQKYLVNAENVIATHVASPADYNKVVEKANSSADFLVAVVGASESNGRILPENTAVELVRKDRNLRALSEELDLTQSELSETAQVANDQRSTLAAQQGAINIDKAVEEISRDFSDREAEVYRQGDKVLLRLRGLHFPIGRAEIPSQSLPLLEKAKTAMSALRAEEVVIEGHADATGDATLNKDLSQLRAESVAKYFAADGNAEQFQAIGYGFDRPITSNKTKMGRAANRRVDVIITPRISQATGDDSAQQNTEIE